MTPAPHVLITDGETRFALCCMSGAAEAGYRVSVVARRANASAHGLVPAKNGSHCRIPVTTRPSS